MKVFQKDKIEDLERRIATRESVESNLSIKIEKAEKRGILCFRPKGKNDKWQKKYFELAFSSELGFFTLTVKHKDKKEKVRRFIFFFSFLTFYIFRILLLIK